MSEADARVFLAGSHARLSYTREHRQIDVGQEHWLVGFVPGAPRRVSKWNLGALSELTPDWG